MGGVCKQILTQPIDLGYPFKLANVPEDPDINAALRKHFAIPVMRKIRMDLSALIPPYYKEKARAIARQR